MPIDSSSNELDIPFVIPQVHRMRFTRDVLGTEPEVLLKLLERSGDQPARVQFWMDSQLDRARPDLQRKIRQQMKAAGDHVQMIGGVQLVPGGEEIKNDIHILERMLKVINAADLDRRSYMVVIGGGAVLDAVGFAAGIAHRGIRLIRLPTTTLSQADSGVGVKNSVNLFRKKNWVGSFAVPWGVINDADLLRTLPQREFQCGFSEAVKVSLLKDVNLFDDICRLGKHIAARDMDAALPVIRRSAEWHLRHITQGGDPYEMLEARPLDYGHWSAHKLEAMTDFELRHGEAVAVGVAIDTVYSSLVHGLPMSVAQRVLQSLTDLGFAFDYPVLQRREELFAGLEEFRQHLGGRLTLTMLRGIGQPLEVHEVDRARMNEAIDFVAKYSQREVVAARKS